MIKGFFLCLKKEVEGIYNISDNSDNKDNAKKLEKQIFPC